MGEKQIIVLIVLLYMHVKPPVSEILCASNHMFKKEIWDKFTEFTFLKFWNLPSQTREISKFQKMNEVNFPQISRINMRFLVNHMWQALKENTRVRITREAISWQRCGNVKKWRCSNSGATLQQHHKVVFLEILPLNVFSTLYQRRFRQCFRISWKASLMQTQDTLICKYC